jgi:uncharacterized membrane protein YsdA (DUF1294 family)
MNWPKLALYWLIFSNLTGFVLMAWDKHRSRNGGRRIAESTLIIWSLIGGAHGIFAAQHICHHKTRKQPISSILTILMVVLSTLYCILYLGLIPLPLPG